MPVKYTYRAADHTIYIECYGELTIQEISDYFKAIETDERIPKGSAELVDLRRITLFNVDHTEAASMPESYSPAHAKREIIATILFGANRINQSLASLIEAYFRRSMPAHLFALVENYQEALNHLAAIRAELESDSA